MGTVTVGPCKASGRLLQQSAAEYRTAGVGVNRFELARTFRLMSFGSASQAIRRRVVDHRRGLAGAAVLLAVLGVAVLTIRPWSTTTYDLDDSGVWVTRTDGGGQIGRVNAQIAAVDYARGQVGSSPGIVQDGRDAYLVTTERSTTSISQLDVTDADADPTATLDVGREAQVGAGGGRVAVLTDATLRVVGTGGTLGASGPAIEVGEDGLLAVGPDGAVAGYSPAAGRIHLLAAGQTEPAILEVPELDVAEETQVSFTLVGDRPVVLDATGSQPRLLVPGGDPLELADDDEGATLQRPGPDAAQVLVATEAALLEVDLGDGDREVIDDTGSGDPVRPAVGDDCAYGAWVATDTVLVAVHCADRDPARDEFDTASSTWRFRTGGPAVVLNDTTSGTTILMADGALERAEFPDEEEQTTTETEFLEEPPNPRVNEPPVAVADTGGAEKEGVGARAGRVTYLPLLRNDIDPNGDILAVDIELKDITTGFEDLIDVVPDGRSVKIDLSGELPRSTGTVRFSYRATDGEMLSDYVDVDVEFVAEGEGHAPEAIRLPAMRHEVVAGARASFEVLSAFWDYDGDPLYLEAVDSSRPAHRVSWTPAGRITFTADQPDTVTLAIVVKDITGRDVTDPPSVTVVVTTPEQPGAPVLRNDVVAAVVNREAIVDPLANDLDPTGERVQLTGEEPEVLRAAEPSGLGPLIVDDQRRLRFTPTTPGDYVLLYQVENRGKPVEATILVRVAAEPSPPLLRPDVVVVQEGKSDEIDLLANDTDPAGGLLSITDLTPPDGLVPEDLSRLMSISVQDDYRTLRVDLRAEATSTEPPFTFTYSAVNDTAFPSTSTVTVVVVPPVENRPPDTREARVSVRAGGVATVPLAAFASDPDDDPLEVELPSQPEVGEARPSGDSIRYFAPPDAGGQEVEVDVRVTEPTGNPQPARITMVVVGPDADSPPLAPDLEARVRAGGSVVVPLPVNRFDRVSGKVGLDPDGDAVRLVGRSGTEQIDGKITVDQGRQAFVLETDPTARQDLAEFTYQVVDSTGQLSDDGTVRVLVTETDENHPPVAMVDRASARAGDEIFVDPVANDTDLDGDPLVLSERIGREGVDGPLVVVTPERCEAEKTKEGLVNITTNAGANAEERCTVAYSVVDTVEGAPEGASASLPQEGGIVVAIRPGFTGVRPFARDDYVLRSATSDSGVAVVDVRANDEDGDGDPSALQVALVNEDGAAVASLPDVVLDPDTGQLTVQLTDEARVIRYRVTDVDNLEADAVVRVPAARENAPPELAQEEPLEVRAGERRPAVELATLVRDPDGDTAQITFGGAPAPKGLNSGPLQNGLSEGLLVLEADPEATGTVEVPIKATDAGGAAAILAIEVVILAAENSAPEWTGQTCGRIEAGSTRMIPLRASDRDTADNGSLVFDVRGGSRGQVTARIDGRTLVATADDGASPGRSVDFTLTVKDGRGGETAQECSLDVVRSRQPPLRVAEAGLTVKQGETKRINVSDDVANEVDGLRIEGTPTVVPSTAGRVTGSGSTVTFRAADNASGQAVVTYEVSHDRKIRGGARESATGRIVIQIVGRPDAPTGVTASALEEPGSVEIRWVPGKANGSPVTGYEVEVTPGGTRRCDATPCTISGLKADGSSAPLFRVRARNAVGVSEQSAGFRLSEPLDQPPSRPSVSGVARGPGEGSGRLVLFTIEPGEAKGSRVIAYEEVSVPDGGRLVDSTDSTRLYEVPGGPGASGRACLSVTAVNVSGAESPASRLGCANDTFGRPSVTNVTVAPAAEGLRGTVTWTEDGNGRAITSRTVEGSGCRAPSPTEGRAEIVCQSRGEKTLTVTVSTAEGGSSTSAPIVGDFWERPTVEGATLAALGGGQVRIATDFDDGGQPITGGTYVLLVDGQERSGTLDEGGAAIVSGLAPWSTSTVTSASVCRGELCSTNSIPDSDELVLETVAPDPVIIDAGRVLDADGKPTGELEITFTWTGHVLSPHDYGYLVRSDLTSGQRSGAITGGQQTVTLGDGLLEGDASLTEGQMSVQVIDLDDDDLSSAEVSRAVDAYPPDAPGGGAPAPRGAIDGAGADRPRRSSAPR